MTYHADRIRQMASMLPDLPPGELKRASGDIVWHLDQLESEMDKRHRVAEAIRTSFGHPPLSETPTATMGERWLRAADAALAAIGGANDDA